jgi:hypothetical protein
MSDWYAIRNAQPARGVDWRPLTQVRQEAAGEK